MPKFRGNTGDISSVQVALNGKQVGMNELSIGYTFTKAQKTLLQNGTYTLTVRDCGMIVEPPNVGECSLDTADLDDHPILFTGTITIKDPTQELGMVPPPPPPPPSPPELPPTQKEDPIPSENSTLKDLITALQKQIKALEDRIADLEAAMFGAAGNETTTIITRTEPPVLPSLEPPANPQQGDYYIRVVSDTSPSFGIGDLIRFEAKAPPCPEPTYSLDGNSVTNKRGITYVLLNNQFVSSIDVMRGVCNNDSWHYYTYPVYDAEGNTDSTRYLESFNATDDHALLSGSLEVTGAMGAGDYYLSLSVFRDSGNDRYYTDTFTLE